MRHHRPGWGLFGGSAPIGRLTDDEPLAERSEASPDVVAQYVIAYETTRDQARMPSYDEYMTMAQWRFDTDSQASVDESSARLNRKRVLMAQAVEGYAAEHPNETVIEYSGATVFVVRRAQVKPMFGPADMGDLPLVMDPRCDTDKFPWRWERHNDESAQMLRDARTANGFAPAADEEHRNRFATWEVQEATTEELISYADRNQS